MDIIAYLLPLINLSFPIMCLILLAKEPTEEFKLVMASNRDEFYSRPTKPAHWWEAPIDLLAGKDLELGGTWMGVSKKGKFAAVTNVREFYSQDYLEKDFLSRGDLVKNFFVTDLNIETYIDSLDLKRYLGFNLVLFDSDEISICSSNGKEKFKKGDKYFVIGNKSFGSNSNKISSARKDFEDILSNDFSNDDLLSLMQNPQEFYEFDQEKLSNNHGNEISGRFIKSSTYGTRSTTVMTINKKNEVKIKEQLYDKNGIIGSPNQFKFTISK